MVGNKAICHCHLNVVLLPIVDVDLVDVQMVGLVYEDFVVWVVLNYRMNQEKDSRQNEIGHVYLMHILVVDCYGLD